MNNTNTLLQKFTSACNHGRKIDRSVAVEKIRNLSTVTVHAAHAKISDRPRRLSGVPSLLYLLHVHSHSRYKNWRSHLLTFSGVHSQSGSLGHFLKVFSRRFSLNMRISLSSKLKNSRSSAIVFTFVR